MDLSKMISLIDILILYYRNNLVKIIVGFKKYKVKIIAGAGRYWKTSSGDSGNFFLLVEGILEILSVYKKVTSEGIYRLG